MMLKRALILFASMIALASMARAMLDDGPASGAHLPSQAAADILRDVASTDGAFLAAGLVRESYQAENLASLLQYPTDELVVVTAANFRPQKDYPGLLRAARLLLSIRDCW